MMDHIPSHTFKYSKGTLNGKCKNSVTLLDNWNEDRDAPN